LQSNEDTWTDKLWYNIYLPTRYYIFGTSVTAEFTLCPLQKGITIGKIRMEILERVTLSTEQGRYKTQQTDQIVASREQDVPEHSIQPLTEEQTGIADESYHFKVTLPLERSLVKARQSVDTENIKIWHNLKIYVNLHNPDGHISQVCLVRAKFFLERVLTAVLACRPQFATHFHFTESTRRGRSMRFGKPFTNCRSFSNSGSESRGTSHIWFTSAGSVIW